MLYIMTERGWQPWLPSYRVCDNHNKLEGVYRPDNRDELPVKMKGRIARFLEANGIGNMLEKQHHFRGDHFNEPIYGAYGEKL